MIPKYERKVGDLLTTVKEGSAAELEDADVARNVAGNEAGDVARNVARPPSPTQPAATEDASHPTDSLAAVQQRLSAMPPIVLGKDMADNLGVTVGDPVLVVSPQGELTPFGMVPKYNRFRVVGIFNSGFFDYDSSWAFVRLSDAQRLFGLGDLISVMEFKVDDIYKADVISRQLEDAAGKGFMATNWMEQNKPLFHALNEEKLLTRITVGLIVVVAALNILIALIMMVMEKTKDIAVLMSMGAYRSQVRNIFIAQGVLIGAVGTVLGLAIGYVLSFAGGHYHVITLSPEVYSIDYVPFAPKLADGIWVTAFSLIVSFVATLYPSWSAARILPAEALRYE
jgi:lipoprotein-releasing system permease protein